MILEALLNQLGGHSTRLIGEQIGASPKVTESAISKALPLLLSALADNSSGAAGARSLAGAVDRDHDGQILDNLSGFLSAGQTAPGDAILHHILGRKRNSLEAGLGQSCGLTVESAGKLLSMLAPVVMGALGKTKRQNGLDENGLASLLAGIRSEAYASPGAASLLSLLDGDGDGQVVDDIGAFLGRFLK